MKRSKRLYILLGILLVTCIATFMVTQRKENKEKIKTSGEIVLEVASDSVQSLSWKKGKTSLAFHKSEKWLYDEDEQFPVDEDKIREMLKQFESFGVSFVIEEVTDYSMYGLDKPECVIQFSTADQSYKIELGNFSNMDQERYVSIGDGKVYLAKLDPLKQFDVELKDIIKHDDVLSYDQIKRVTFQGAENYGIFYSKESTASYCRDDVYFTEKDNVTLPLDTKRVDSWLKDISTLKLTDYVTYNATEDELKSYNLTNPELTVTVDYTPKDAGKSGNTDTFVLSISRDPAELAAAEAAKTNGKKPTAVSAYARVGDSQIIYKISEQDSTRVRGVSYNELRHREVMPVNFDDVQKIEITLEGVDYTIAADGKNKDGKLMGKFNEKEIEIDDLQNALASLAAEHSDDFTSDTPAGKEEIRMTVHLNNEAHPEVKIELYRYDGEKCLAVVDGRTFARIPRSQAVRFIEAVNAIVLN